MNRRLNNDQSDYSILVEKTFDAVHLNDGSRQDH